MRPQNSVTERHTADDRWEPPLMYMYHSPLGQFLGRSGDALGVKHGLWRSLVALSPLHNIRGCNRSS
jgi:hypothetical protein